MEAHIYRVHVCFPQTANLVLGLSPAGYRTLYFHIHISSRTRASACSPFVHHSSTDLNQKGPPFLVKVLFRDDSSFHTAATGEMPCGIRKHIIQHSIPIMTVKEFMVSFRDGGIGAVNERLLNLCFAGGNKGMEPGM